MVVGKAVNKFVFALLVAGLLIPAGRVSAVERPREVFNERERVIAKILEDQTLDEKARKEKLLATMRESFDYQELAKRSLGNHWEQINPKQRSEFTSILKELIEFSILSKVKPVQDFTAEVVKEVVEGSQATLASAVSTRGKTEPVQVEFQMTTKQNRGWVVYDMIIDDVSLLTSYRQQFMKIIKAESFDSLLSKMNARLQKTRHQLAAL